MSVEPPLRREVELPRRMPIAALTLVAVLTSAIAVSRFAALREFAPEPQPQADGLTPTHLTIDPPTEDTPCETPSTPRRLQQLRDEVRDLGRQVEQLKAKQFGSAHRPIHFDTACVTNPMLCR